MKVVYDLKDVQEILDFFSNNATYTQVLKVVETIKRGQTLESVLADMNKQQTPETPQQPEQAEPVKS